VSIQSLKKLDTGGPKFFEKRKMARRAKSTRARIYEPQNNLKNPEGVSVADQSFKTEGTRQPGQSWPGTPPLDCNSNNQGPHAKAQTRKVPQRKTFWVNCNGKGGSRRSTGSRQAEARSRREMLFGFTAKAKATARHSNHR
jgi:hypothetical protein